MEKQETNQVFCSVPCLEEVGKPFNAGPEWHHPSCPYHKDGLPKKRY